MTGTAPLVHIGYHKSATSFLQNLVFSKDPAFCQPWGTQPAEAIEHFVLTHPERFDADAVRAGFEDGIEGARVPVLSHEGLSGNPVFARYDMDRVAGRLAQVFPGARIVIGIREQKGMLRSLYYQYVRQGGTDSPERMLKAGAGQPGFRPTLRLDHLEYDLTLAHYRRHFGEDAVLALPIEHLRADPGDYLARLYRFAGLEPPAEVPSDTVNARRSERAMRLERALNRIVQRPIDRPRRFRDNPWPYRAKLTAVGWADKLLPGSTGALDRLIAEVTEGVFAASNQRMSDMTGLDLTALGYDT